jgi:hypothetical protein
MPNHNILLYDKFNSNVNVASNDDINDKIKELTKLKESL